MERGRLFFGRAGEGNSIGLNVCAFCGLTENRLMVCSRCKVMKYCSRECQRTHWNESHRRDCVPYIEGRDINTGNRAEPLNQGHINANSSEQQAAVFSLDHITRGVKNAIDHGSRLVFYCHIEKQWLAVMRESALTLQVNVSFMKSLFIERHIEVRSWGSIVVDGVTLYPMVVKFPGQVCPEWMLLAERGIPADSDWTPYLFVNEEARRRIMDMIMNNDVVVPRADQLRMYL